MRAFASNSNWSPASSVHFRTISESRSSFSIPVILLTEFSILRTCVSVPHPMFYLIFRLLWQFSCGGRIASLAYDTSDVGWQAYLNPITRSSSILPWIGLMNLRTAMWGFSSQSCEFYRCWWALMDLNEKPIVRNGKPGCRRGLSLLEVSDSRRGSP